MKTDEMIFVFGSNEGGIHGAGAAKFAFEQRGARWGKAFGISGQSFAIPTKDASIRHTLPLDKIGTYVEEFLEFAMGSNMRDVQFQVTRLGCGLAGLKDGDVSPMFFGAPDNCWFDTAWQPWLGERNYWGHF